jgi:endonuclease/exonuclease/phosphatase family metal-dependent hydrolase
MTDDMIAEAGLRIASVNWHFGGIDPRTGDKAGWRKTVDALLTWYPDIILCQEISDRAARELQKHLWETANVLGMIPVIGPPTPQSVTGNHPAILVRADAGLEIFDEGPTGWPPGGGAWPAWCEAALNIPHLTRPLRVYSVHLPPRSAQEQLSQIQRLATYVAQRGEYAVVAGDFNSYARGDEITSAMLQSQPPHLRPSRMRRTPDGQLAANYDVHDTLASIGMLDAAAFLPPGLRDPSELAPTAPSGGRIDRCYVTRELGPAVSGYIQRDTGGSDHHALMVTLQPGQVTDLPPGPFA